MPTRLLLLAIGAAVVFAAPASAADKCGSTNKSTGAIVKAKLTIDPDSVTAIAFKRDTTPQRLLVRFKVSGCELPKRLAPSTDLLPMQGSKNIPENAIKLQGARPDGGELTLTLVADPREFTPGTYEGFMEVRSALIATTRVPLTLSRSEDNEAVPIVIGLIGGLASVIWFVGLHLAGGATSPKWWHYVLAFVAAAIFGAFAVETAYRSQEVWSFSENSASAIIAAFTGATTGTMLAALAVLFPDPEEE